MVQSAKSPPPVPLISDKNTFIYIIPFILTVPYRTELTATASDGYFSSWVIGGLYRIGNGYWCHWGIGVACGFNARLSDLLNLVSVSAVSHTTTY